jgi:hypothetical protein
MKLAVNEARRWAVRRALVPAGRPLVRINGLCNRAPLALIGGSGSPLWRDASSGARGVPMKEEHPWPGRACIGAEKDLLQDAAAAISGEVASGAGTRQESLTN